jgi:hypothetical protein
MNSNRRNVVRSALALAAATALILGGCAKNGGDEFIGTWQEKERKATTMQIERNGDGFLMKTTSTNRRGQQNTGSVPATLKDGILTYPNGPVTGTVTYVKSDNELLVSTFAGNFTFTRLK